MEMGRLVAILPRSYQGKYRNKFHYGSEVLFSTHASAIVPKGSRLKVILKDMADIEPT